MTERTQPVEADAYTRDYFTSRCGGIEFFQKFGFKVLKPANQLAVVSASLQKSHRCLDLGCGRGELVAHLHEQGYDITGVDYAKEALDVAKAMYPAGRYVLGRATERSFPDASFDRIFCLGTIEHLTDDEVAELLSGAYALLKPGGRLIVTTCTNALYQKTLTYRFRAAVASLFKLRMPLPPRSEEDEQLHINEMNRFSLERHFSRLPWKVRVIPVTNPKIYAPDVYNREILPQLPLKIAPAWKRTLYRAILHFPLSLFLARSHCVVAEK